MTSPQTISLQYGVEGHNIVTSTAAAVPDKVKSRSYGAVAFWREVPVLPPHQQEENEGGRSNSAGGIGEFLSCGPESLEAPNLSCHGKL